MYALQGHCLYPLFDYHILARFTGALYAMAASKYDTGKNSSRNGFQRSQKMAEDRTDSVSAGGDRQDRRDRLSFLYDRSYGEEDEFTQSLYDTWWQWVHFLHCWHMSAQITSVQPLLFSVLQWE